MQIVKVKINHEARRIEMFGTLAEAGYKTWVEEKKRKNHSSDYIVRVVVPDEEVFEG